MHIVGAGLAGLSAAVSLVRAGHGVAVHEAGSRAGGRCRSYVDARLDRLIDNGNHLVLSGNRSAMRYLDEVGAHDGLVGPDSARFPFLDLRTGRRWQVRPNSGWVPWWVLCAGRRVPDTSARSYLSALRFRAAGPDRTVSDCVGRSGVLFERFWEPLAVAALNTPARVGAARLLWPVLRETFARGEAACRPRIARRGTVARVRGPGSGAPRPRRSVDAMGAPAARDRLSGRNRDGASLRRGDRRARAWGPGHPRRAARRRGRAGAALVVPEESNPIVNVHFRLSEPARLPAGMPFLGLVGGTAQWLFVRGDVASVTVSAAGTLAAEPAGAIARKTWRDVAAALAADPDVPPAVRVVKERRATFAQTPEQVRRRPATRTGFANLYLAGDWIDTGLPATIEGAVRSGHLAARAARGP